MRSHFCGVCVLIQFYGRFQYSTDQSASYSSSECDASRRLTFLGERERHGDSLRLLLGVRDTERPRSGSGVRVA